MMRTSGLIILLVILAACKPEKKPASNTSGNDTTSATYKNFDIQGHRGFRGMYPENSIPGFIAALETGVTTLELDVVISKDSQLVVSHEPWMSGSICNAPDGTSIREKDSMRYSIWTWNYEDLKDFDCGTVPHPRFPLQQKIKIHKPLLSEVVDSVKAWEKKHPDHPPVAFNIETKSKPEWDHIFTPGPDMFVRLLDAELKKLGIGNRTTIQSFDVRTLRKFKTINPGIKLVLLIENTDGMENNLQKLGFIPDTYSPYYELVTASLIDSCHRKGMKIIPWTVNSSLEMRKLIQLGTDGMITDFPDSLVQVIRQPR